MQLFAGEARLALKQRSGCGLQNEFGALNALVLVALESSSSQQREDGEEAGKGEGETGEDGCGRRETVSDLSVRQMQGADIGEIPAH